MAPSRKQKKADRKPEPHTEKSTMTEPQEEFIEEKARPSRPASPSELEEINKQRGRTTQK